MATLNQQMEDLLSPDNIELFSPDDMMLQGMEQGTLKQAQENTKEFVKDVATGAALSFPLAVGDTVDLGAELPALEQKIRQFFPVYSGMQEAFEQLSKIGISRQAVADIAKSRFNVDVEDNVGTFIGEGIGVGTPLKYGTEILSAIASAASKYGPDAPFMLNRIADDARQLFNTASGGDDLDGMAPAVAGDAPTPTTAADTAELPDTSTTKMMVGEKGSVGEDAIFRYERLKNENPDLTKEELYAQTGVYMGRDGMPRYELDTQEAVLIGKNHPIMAGSDSFDTLAGLDRRSIPDNKNLRVEALEDGDVIELQEIVDFPSLFNQYSDVEAPIQNIYSNKPFGADYDPIQNIQINIENINRSGSVAYYSPESDTITISADLVDKPEEFLSVLLHEVQHAVQHREGFSSGSNVAMFYKRAGFELGYDDLELDSAAAWDSRFNKAAVRSGSGIQNASKNFKQNSPIFKKDQTNAGELDDPATLMVMSLRDLFAKRMDNDSYKKDKIYSDEEKDAIFTLTDKDIDDIVKSEDFDELVSDNLKERVEKDLRSFKNAMGNNSAGLHSVFKQMADGEVEIKRLMQIKQRARLNYERTYGELESRLVQERLGMRKKLAAEGYSTQEIRDIMAEKYPPVDMAINQYAVMDPDLDEGAKAIAEKLLVGDLPEGMILPKEGYPSYAAGNRGMGQLRVKEDSPEILTDPDAYSGFNESAAIAESAPAPRKGYDPTDETSRVFHLTKKDFDVADVIRSGTDDIGFHVGTAAQATARGSTGKPYDGELMEGMTKGERILPMVLKQNLKPARIPDMSSFKEPRNWLGNLSISTSDLQGMKFLKGDPEDAKLLENAPRVTVDGETRIMMPDAIRAGVDPDLWKDLILEASRARRIGLDTINNQEDRVAWFNTLKATANKHGYDSFVYRNEYEGSDNFNVDALAEQIQRASRGEIDPSEVDVNTQFADSYMLLEPDQAKGIFGDMTEGNPAFMKNRGGLI